MGKRFSFRVNKSTIKLHLRFGRLHFFTVVSKHPDVETVGMSNLCSDGRFVLFIDYDDTFLYRVIDEVRILQRKFRVGSVAILSTGGTVDLQGKEYGNYHVVGFAKFRFHDMLDMLEGTSCDRNFRRIPQIFNGRSWTLRIAPKMLDGREIKGMPYLKRMVYAKTGLEMSRPHYKFLMNVYGMPKLPRKYMSRFDRSDKLKTVYYQTTQGGWGLKDLLLPKTLAIKSSGSNIKK